MAKVRERWIQGGRYCRKGHRQKLSFLNFPPDWNSCADSLINLDQSELGDTELMTVSDDGLKHLPCVRRYVKECKIPKPILLVPLQLQEENQRAPWMW